MKAHRGYTAELQHTIEEFEYGGECLAVTIDIEAKISGYSPQVNYLRNGDPGYPAEGGEIDDVKFRVVEVMDGECENWPKERLENERKELTAAVNKWYDNANNQDHLDELIYSADPPEPPERERD